MNQNRALAPFRRLICGVPAVLSLVAAAIVFALPRSWADWPWWAAAGLALGAAAGIWWLLANLLDRPAKELISVADAEERWPVLRTHRSEDWVSFQHEILEGDELWHFRSGPCSWLHLAGREYLFIKRGAKTVSRFMIMLN